MEFTINILSNPETGIIKPVLVSKRWGHEKIFVNGDAVDTKGLGSYCMKEIFISHGNCTSMHFHVNKSETLYIADGILTVLYNDGKSGSKAEIVLRKNDALQIPPGFQHQLCAWDGDVVIIEASTPDDPQDSFRVTM
jgi:D-lyxose ketol-isomerase